MRDEGGQGGQGGPMRLGRLLWSPGSIRRFRRQGAMRVCRRKRVAVASGWRGGLVGAMLVEAQAK